MNKRWGLMQSDDDDTTKERVKAGLMKGVIVLSWVRRDVAVGM